MTSEETTYRIDDENTIETVYLADDAVKDFLDEGSTYNAAYAANDLDLGPFYSLETLDRIPEEGWEISYWELSKVANGYNERPMRRPEWYDGEQKWLDQVEIAKFTGTENSNILMISEEPSVKELVEEKEYMFTMSPKEFEQLFES